MLQPGTDEYLKHLEGELEHYSRVFAAGEEDPNAKRTLFQPVPGAWQQIEVKASALIAQRTGFDLNGHMIRRLTARPGVRMISLGCGPAGVELAYARMARGAHMHCMDINENLLQLGRAQAAAENLNMEFSLADLNTVTLPPKAFDIVFCHASLHHVIDLERLMDQISNTLAAGGELITVDIISRNGYLMWPETREVVEALWATLPPRFRVNNTAYAAPELDTKIWEADASLSGMECIRSQDILPLLEKRFERVEFVPYFAISRRFFDTMYGPNYDLSAPLDRALFEWIWQLDLHYVDTGALRPETFFGIYRNA